MTTMFWCTWGTIFLLITSALASEPYELHIRHSNAENEPSSCSYMTLRRIRRHKGVERLAGGPHIASGLVFNDKRLGQTDSDYTRLISYDLESLHDEAESFCGPSKSWDFPLMKEKDIDWSTNPQDINGQVLFGSTEPSVPAPPMEIVPLVVSGPAQNRINLAFFSDGYTEDDRDKFVNDALRLANDISKNQTFATVRPLLNFWAAFSPSQESGIGVGGTPKDTVFGLYRDGTELRGVYCKNTLVAEAACFELGDKCHYPILLGNDPLYGGLGGRFTISTSSNLNGPLILRHELGHSIIGTGDEYDGSYAYFGVNSAEDLDEPFPWSHWLNTHPDLLRAERAVMPAQAYPWTMLTPCNPWTLNFTSSGDFSRYNIRFSVSGIPEKQHLHIELDGEPVDWAPKPGVGLDRWHYDIFSDVALVGGYHNITFALGPRGIYGVAQLGSVEIIEFGDKHEYNTDEGFIGAFPTFSDKNETTFRPTDNSCLMRTVTKPNLCPVCLEGLWVSLMERIDLIEDLYSGCVVDNYGVLSQYLEVSLIPLAKYRSNDNMVNHNEQYIITWGRGGRVMEWFTNQSRIEVGNYPATYTVEIQFFTDEVRVDKDRYLTSTRDISIVNRCYSGGPY